MSLAFLSTSTCAEGTVTSPLRRTLEGADPEQVRDLSLEGIVEIRTTMPRWGIAAVMYAVGEEFLELSPGRAFIFTEDPAGAVERHRSQGLLAYDVTGAYAGLAIADEQVLRRLTDLDLDSIPTAGPFAHVTALFRRGADGWVHVYVHQELGHYVAEAVLDAITGLQA